jgi:hypothetical protein
LIPFGAFVGILPPVLFLVLHLAAFAAGAYFAFRAFGAARSSLGWGFTLFALAELLYVSYHLDLTVLLFAHLIAELLLVTAVVLIYRATRASA